MNILTEITDKQIGQLLNRLGDDYERAAADAKRARSQSSRDRAHDLMDNLRETIAYCKIALGSTSQSRRDEARARCLTAWNADEVAGDS